MRVACRHVAQALRKEQSPAWCRRIFDPVDGVAAAADGAANEDDAEDGDCDGKAADETGDEDRFAMWGYDAELLAAWRATGPYKKDEKQVSKDLREPPDASPADAMLVVFPDGRQYELADLTVEDWRLKQQAIGRRKHGTGQPPLWRMLCERGELSVRVRADRHPLVALFVDGRQRCQVRLDAFASQDEAVKLMSAILGYLPGSLHLI